MRQMDKNKFAPIVDPDTWDLMVSSGEALAGRVRKWKFANPRSWFTSALAGYKERKAYELVAYKTSENIIMQLESRTLEFKYDDELRDNILMILRKSVAKEKGMKDVLIYPDDPIKLLLWGPYDDLSPLLFLIDIEKCYKVRIDPILYRRLINEDITANEFVEKIAGIILKKEQS